MFLSGEAHMHTVARSFSVQFGLLFASVFAIADPGPAGRDCRPLISFVEVDSFDVVAGAPLKVKGKLTVPAERHRGACAAPRHDVPAVVILHGTAGVDFRGNFYAEALTDTGFATLEIDMWEARGVTDISGRPPLPAYTYPDAFAALAFLSAYPGIDPQRIGVLGFSWGGVMSVATATENVVGMFGGGVLRFKAHVAHYPICYAYNNPYIPNSQFGSHAGNALTGAPIMIQIGDQDDYDMSAEPCQALQASLIASERALMRVVTYEGATHAWDALLVPAVWADPSSHLGLGGPVRHEPNVDAAYDARGRVVAFFRHHL
jgi:dienelactone hydrolase